MRENYYKTKGRLISNELNCYAWGAVKLA